MTEGRRRRVRKEEQVWVWSQWWRRAGAVEDTRLDTAGHGEESRLAWVLQGPCHGGPLAGEECDLFRVEHSPSGSNGAVSQGVWWGGEGVGMLLLL